jgi:hypothetical protein
MVRPIWQRLTATPCHTPIIDFILRVGNRKTAFVVIDIYNSDIMVSMSCMKYEGVKTRRHREKERLPVWCNWFLNQDVMAL